MIDWEKSKWSNKDVKEKDVNCFRGGSSIECELCKCDCLAEENAEEQTEEAEDSSNSEGEEDADLEESDNPEIEEGYTTELEGCTKVVSWCKNGDNKYLRTVLIIRKILTKQRLIQ